MKVYFPVDRDPYGLPEMRVIVEFEAESSAEDARHKRRVRVTVHYTLRGGRIVIKRVTAGRDGEGTAELTSNLFRGLRLGEIRNTIHQEVTKNPGLLDPDVTAAQLVIVAGGTPPSEEIEGLNAALRAARIDAVHLETMKPNRGRGADNQELYGDVARLYLDLLKEHGQHTVKALAEYYGRPRNTVYWWVRKAREEGWLSPSLGQGRAGGSPGWRLLQWLEEKEEEK